MFAAQAARLEPDRRGVRRRPQHLARARGDRTSRRSRSATRRAATWRSAPRARPAAASSPSPRRRSTHHTELLSETPASSPDCAGGAALGGAARGASAAARSSRARASCSSSPARGCARTVRRGRARDDGRPGRRRRPRALGLLVAQCDRRRRAAAPRRPPARHAARRRCSSSRKGPGSSRRGADPARARAGRASVGTVAERRPRRVVALAPTAGARAARLRALLPAREHRRAAPPAAPPARRRAATGAPRESLEEAFERLARRPTTSCSARLGDVSLELVLTAHPTEATRRTLLRAHVRIAELLARHDDPDLPPAERAELEERARRGDHDPLADRRGAARPPRVVDEIRHGLWFFEQSLFDAGERLLRDYRGACPGAPPPLSFGTLDRRRHRRQPGGRRRDDRARRSSGRAQSALAPLPRRTCASSRSRSPRAARSSRSRPSSRSRSRATSASAPTTPARSAAQNEREPYRRKLSFMWWRLGNDGYATPDELLDDLAVIAREPRGARRRAASPTAALAALERHGRALRLPRREARRAAARARGAAADRADARRLRGGRGGPRAARRRGARHGDRLGDVVGRRRARACSTLTDEPVAVVPLFETIADLDAAPAIVDDAARRRALRRGSPSAATGSR